MVESSGTGSGEFVAILLQSTVYESLLNHGAQYRATHRQTVSTEDEG